MDILVKSRHVLFLNRCLQALPSEFITLDTSKLTILYFAISSFDLLDELDKLKPSRAEIIDWIYGMQIREDTNQVGCWGFRGTPNNGKSHSYDKAHLTMTFAALNTLLILEDDLSRVDRLAIIKGLRQYQDENGSFCPIVGEESDMRFVYCAASICFLLKDWTSVNVDLMVDYIQSCLTFEGAFGQCPDNEAHGGSTYCAVAALVLCGRLDQVLDQEARQKLIHWCVNKQSSGFEGRPNKEADTCYTFWLGATLKLLESNHLVNEKQLVQFVLNTQDAIVGGLAKTSYSSPDLLHTYLGLSGLSLLNKGADLGLLPVNAKLNISERAFRFWERLPISTCL